MRRLLPHRLRGRLLLANLVVAGAAIGTVLVGVSLVGPGYFEEAMGHRPGDPAGRAMDELTLAAFRQATGTALLGATITAVLAAIVVSLALATRVANPVSRLAAAAHRIAAGHYAERVPHEGEGGEVAELAESFNQMSASLEATERRRLQLVGDVAHELRTPLSTLDGYLEGLEDGVVAPTPETWRVLRREARRLTGLVDDLQELWRAEARELPLNLDAVDLGQVLEEAARRFEQAARERGITIVNEAAGPASAAAAAITAIARADRDRVVQIVANYLSNALRHAPQGGQVTIGSLVAGDEVRVWVHDAGPGLTADQRSRVFERFYRVDASRSRSEGGSGIGLAIVRALAEAMDGHAWAESDGPGAGSTFWVALPASRP